MRPRINITEQKKELAKKIDEILDEILLDTNVQGQDHVSIRSGLETIKNSMQKINESGQEEEKVVQFMRDVLKEVTGILQQLSQKELASQYDKNILNSMNRLDEESESLKQNQQMFFTNPENSSSDISKKINTLFSNVSSKVNQAKESLVKKKNNFFGQFSASSEYAPTQRKAEKNSSSVQNSQIENNTNNTNVSNQNNINQPKNSLANKVENLMNQCLQFQLQAEELNSNKFRKNK